MLTENALSFKTITSINGETTPLLIASKKAARHANDAAVSVNQITPSVFERVTESRVFKTGGRFFHVLEDGANGYWFYITACNYPAWRGLWGYGFVGGGLALGAYKQRLNSTHPKYYKIVNTITEQAVFGSFAISYLQSFPTVNSFAWSIAGDAAVIGITVAGSIWHFKLKNILKNTVTFEGALPVILKGTAKALSIGYNGLLGASFAYYGVQLATNFFAIPSNIIAITSQVAAGALYAGVNCFTPNKEVFGQKAAQTLHILSWLALNTLSYSSDLGFIVFNIFMDAFAAYKKSQGQDNEVTNAQLYISLSAALTFLMASTLYYGINSWQTLDDEEEADYSPVIEESSQNEEAQKFNSSYKPSAFPEIEDINSNTSVGNNRYSFHYNKEEQAADELTIDVAGLSKNLPENK